MRYVEQTKYLFVAPLVGGLGVVAGVWVVGWRRCLLGWRRCGAPIQLRLMMHGLVRWRISGGRWGMRGVDPFRMLSRVAIIKCSRSVLGRLSCDLTIRVRHTMKGLFGVEKCFILRKVYRSNLQDYWLRREITDVGGESPSWQSQFFRVSVELSCHRVGVGGFYVGIFDSAIGQRAHDVFIFNLFEPLVCKNKSNLLWLSAGKSG